MKTDVIRSSQADIVKAQKNKQICLSVFSKIKDLPGIQFIEKTIGLPLIISFDRYSNHPMITISKDFSPDIMCSVAAEIELALDCAFEVTPYITDKQVVYNFFAVKYTSSSILDETTILRIRLLSPTCKWVVESNVKHTYTSTSTTVQGRMVCQ